jgi:hypothetical protein
VLPLLLSTIFVRYIGAKPADSTADDDFFNGHPLFYDPQMLPLNLCSFVYLYLSSSLWSNISILLRPIKFFVSCFFCAPCFELLALGTRDGKATLQAIPSAKVSVKNHELRVCLK